MYCFPPGGVRFAHQKPEKLRRFNAVQLTLRVRYAETDQMGMVHHSNYLIWFEAARSEFCRQFGIDYRQMEIDGLFLPVAEAQCRYIGPAFYEDEIVIKTWVIELKRSVLQNWIRSAEGGRSACGPARPFRYWCASPITDHLLISTGRSLRGLREVIAHPHATRIDQVFPASDLCPATDPVRGIYLENSPPNASSSRLANL